MNLGVLGLTWLVGIALLISAAIPIVLIWLFWVDVKDGKIW
jgi:hypothetical protein